MGFIQVNDQEHYTFDGQTTECGLDAEGADEIYHVMCPSRNMMCPECWEALQEDDDVDDREERMTSRPVKWR